VLTLVQKDRGLDVNKKGSIMHKRGINIVALTTKVASVRRWLFLFMGLCLYGAVQAQLPTTTQGTEFYVSFMPNSSGPTLKLLVSAKRDCEVTVQRSNNTVAKTFSVSAGGIYTYLVTNNDAYANVNGLSSKSLKVTSTDTISLYASNRVDYSADANNVLPTPALGSKYMVMSYAGISNFPAQRSTVLIVATENGTTVKITPRTYRDSTATATEILSGQVGVAGVAFLNCYAFFPDYGSVLVRKNVRITHKQTNGVWSTTVDTTFTYKIPTWGKATTTPAMSAGQTYLYTSDNDLTGSIIEAEDCKKIAVFSGHQRTMVGSTLGSLSSDHLVEQMLPMHSLGKRFVMVPTMDRVKDRYRLLAAGDNTTVTIDGKRVLLHQGLFYENDLREATYVEADKPMMVVMFPISVQSPEGDKDSLGVGDNSMIWINPVEQNLEDIIFGALPTKQVSNHYVNVVVSTKAATLTTLNGQNIGAHFAPVPNNPEYSFTRIGGIADDRAHYLQNPKGLAAYVYGYGTTEAYGYTAGSSVKDLSLGIAASGVNKEEQVMNFLLTGVSENMKIISWQFDSEPPIFCDSVDFPRTFDHAGCKDVVVRYQITSDCGALEKIAYFPAATCIKPSDLSVSGKLEVCEGDTVMAMSLFKGGMNGVGEIRWYKDDTTQVYCTTSPIFDVPGLQTYYVTQVRNEQESDRVAVNITVNKHTAEELRLTVCDSVTVNGITYTTSGSYVQKLVNVFGCDSTLTVHLTVNKSTSGELRLTVCDSVTVNGVTYTTSGSYVQKLVNVSGCDSTLTVHLTVNKSTSGELRLTVCDSVTVNGITYTTSGSYVQKLVNVFGCDSTLTIHLTVNKSTSGELRLTVCDSVTVNGITYTTSGSYVQKLVNVSGCDSTLTVYFTLEVEEVEEVVVVPPAPDTSDTTQPDTVKPAPAVVAVYSAEELLQMTNVYPNPTRGVSTIENENLVMEEITLRDGAGNSVYGRYVSGGKTQFDISNAPSGLYFLIIRTDKGTVVKRVMKIY